MFGFGNKTTYVVSAEGNNYIDKGSWTTHSILGHFRRKSQAEKCAKEAVGMGEEPDDIVIITEMANGMPIKVVRLE